MSEYLKHVLKHKLPISTEIEIHLFEFCNLSCAFCGQDHDNTEGMQLSSMIEKACQVIDFMQKSNMKSHIVNIMGGEIFNDEVPDNLMESYMLFYQKINEWCDTNNHTVRFNWVTNLIFTKSKRVFDIITRMRDIGGNVFISTSYDFAGRGLNINRALQFEHNLKLFSEWITVVGFVLTKPAIRKIIGKRDKFFDEYLYPNFTIYFDYYVPELSAHKMMPSEQEMLDCMLYVAEHYPNVYPVKDMLDNEMNSMTCYSMNKTTILPSGREVKCRYMDYNDDDFVNDVDYSSNDNIIQAHMDRHGCLECEWFDRCTLRCFVQADWAGLERLDDCLFRTFFNKSKELGTLKNGSNN